MHIKDISPRKIFLAIVIFVIGVLCGHLSCMENGLWTVMMGKESGICKPMVGLGVSIFSMCGQASNYILTRGKYFNPFYFWIGQFSFYLFLSISIIMLQTKKRKVSGPDEDE